MERKRKKKTFTPSPYSSPNSPTSRSSSKYVFLCFFILALVFCVLYQQGFFGGKKKTKRVVEPSTRFAEPEKPQEKNVFNQPHPQPTLAVERSKDNLVQSFRRQQRAQNNRSPADRINDKIRYLKGYNDFYHERCAYNLSISSSPALCYQIFPDVFAHLRNQGSKNAVQESVCKHEVVTQMSPNRFDRLEKLLVEWDGFLSVSIFIPRRDIIQVHSELEKLLKKAERSDLKRQKIHIAVPFDAQKDAYPINILRNTAFEYGFDTAEFSSIYDIDFVPSTGLCANIQESIEKFDPQSLSNFEDVEYLFRDSDYHNWNTHCPLKQGCNNNNNNSNSNNDIQDASHLGLKNQRLGRGSLGVNDVLFVAPTMEMISNAPLSDYTTNKEKIQEGFEVDISIFHKNWQGQQIGVMNDWFSTNSLYMLDKEHVHHTEFYGWFHKRTVSARLKASNLTICDDFYFNRGYNKINCYRNIRTQGIYPVILPNGWLIHDKEEYDYQANSPYILTKAMFDLNLCRNLIRSYPGKWPWFFSACQRQIDVGMKKKETLAKLKDKVEKQLAVSSVFKEVSAVVRKSVVTLHNDWEISLFLSCEASSSSLPPSTTAPSLPPSVSRFYTDGWGEGEVGETWCGCGFEGAIGCRSCEVMIDMGQDYGQRIWSNSFQNINTETNATLHALHFTLSILFHDAREILPQFSGVISTKEVTSTVYIPISIRMQNKLAIGCLSSSLYFGPMKQCEPYSQIIDKIHNLKIFLSDRGCDVTFLPLA